MDQLQQFFDAHFFDPVDLPLIKSLVSYLRYILSEEQTVGGNKTLELCVDFSSLLDRRTNTKINPKERSNDSNNESDQHEDIDEIPTIKGEN